MIETILLATTRVSTFDGDLLLSNASGFFFERDDRLYLVTSRHVLFDEASGHAPNRIELTVHADPQHPASVLTLSIWLYRAGTAIWRQASDAGGDVDVAVVEIDRAALGANATLHRFTPAHLLSSLQDVEVGTGLLIPGFPLGFHDAVHQLPVVRQACIASSFGLRFQGHGYFLTDARLHRGSSGAPVVMRDAASHDPLPWKLLGVHSSRMDMGNRDPQADESLGLNCAWYADVLMTLTQRADEPARAPNQGAPNDPTGTPAA